MNSMENLSYEELRKKLDKVDSVIQNLLDKHGEMVRDTEQFYWVLQKQEEIFVALDKTEEWRAYQEELMLEDELRKHEKRIKKIKELSTPPTKKSKLTYDDLQEKIRKVEKVLDDLLAKYGEVFCESEQYGWVLDKYDAYVLELETTDEWRQEQIATLQKEEDDYQKMLMERQKLKSPTSETLSSPEDSSTPEQDAIATTTTTTTSEEQDISPPEQDATTTTTPEENIKEAKNAKESSESTSGNKRRLQKKVDKVDQLIQGMVEEHGEDQVIHCKEYQKLQKKRSSYLSSLEEEEHQDLKALCALMEQRDREEEEKEQQEKEQQEIEQEREKRQKSTNTESTSEKEATNKEPSPADTLQGDHSEKTDMVAGANDLNGMTETEAAVRRIHKKYQVVEERIAAMEAEFGLNDCQNMKEYEKLTKKRNDYKEMLQLEGTNNTKGTNSEKKPSVLDGNRENDELFVEEEKKDEEYMSRATATAASNTVDHNNDDEEEIEIDLGASTASILDIAIARVVEKRLSSRSLESQLSFRSLGSQFSMKDTDDEPDSAEANGNKDQEVAQDESGSRDRQKRPSTTKKTRAIPRRHDSEQTEETAPIVYSDEWDSFRTVSTPTTTSVVIDGTSMVASPLLDGSKAKQTAEGAASGSNCTSTTSATTCSINSDAIANESSTALSATNPPSKASGRRPRLEPIKSGKIQDMAGTLVTSSSKGGIDTYLKRKKSRGLTKRTSESSLDSIMSIQSLPTPSSRGLESPVARSKSSKLKKMKSATKGKRTKATSHTMETPKTPKKGAVEFSAEAACSMELVSPITPSQRSLVSPGKPQRSVTSPRTNSELEAIKASKAKRRISPGSLSPGDTSTGTKSRVKSRSKLRAKSSASKGNAAVSDLPATTKKRALKSAPKLKRRNSFDSLSAVNSLLSESSETTEKGAVKSVGKVKRRNSADSLDLLQKLLAESADLFKEGGQKPSSSKPKRRSGQRAVQESLKVRKQSTSTRSSLELIDLKRVMEGKPVKTSRRTSIESLPDTRNSSDSSLVKKPDGSHHNITKKQRSEGRRRKSAVNNALEKFLLDSDMPVWNTEVM